MNNVCGIVVLSLIAFFQACASSNQTLSPDSVSMNAERPLETSNEPVKHPTALSLPLISPRILISKHERRLHLYSGGTVVRTYRIALGADPVEDKEVEGDRRTPEGRFYIFTKNEKSAYYLSLGLSYPNLEDAERGLTRGVIGRDEYAQIADAIKNKTAPPQKTALGGEIYIHGNGSQNDWTWGCVALDDGDVLELFDAVEIGTEVVIEH